MTTVIVIGSKDDIEIEKYIRTILANSYRITFIKGGKIEKFGTGYDILIYDTETINEIKLPECIIVMKSKGIPPKISLPKRCTIIANSENTKQLGCLQASELNVISCGSQKWDTISFSSFTSDSLMLSLNRKITAFSGKEIEPLEIPIALMNQPLEIYNLIAFTAMRLLLDNFNSEIGSLY